MIETSPTSIQPITDVLLPLDELTNVNSKFIDNFLPMSKFD